MAVQSELLFMWPLIAVGRFCGGCMMDCTRSGLSQLKFKSGYSSLKTNWRRTKEESIPGPSGKISAGPPVSLLHFIPPRCGRASLRCLIFTLCTTRYAMASCSSKQGSELNTCKSVIRSPCLGLRQGAHIKLKPF